MGWFRERRIQAHELDVVNSLVLQGRPVYASGYPGAGYKGETYFVNNVQGNSGNAGNSWNNAMDEFSTAVTAWEAYRATLTTNDQNVRGTIYIQGTATPYAAITALPSYCDVIGIGADPGGNGAGIVRIGADTGSGGGLTGTSSARGLYLANIQFQAGVSNYPFQLADIFRSVLENVVFASNGSPGGAPAVGFEVDRAGGLKMLDCNWLNQSSIGNDFDIGFSVTGTHFHRCKINDCHITGADAALQIAATTINGYHSEFKDCYMGWGSETCAIGINELATVGHIIYRRCDLFATDPILLTHNAANRAIGCMSADGFVIT